MTSEANQPEDFATLYRRAFEQFGASALWSSRPVPNPTPADALAITETLRVEGNLQARRLAEQIEQACRAAV
jgi:3-methyladenine DNA glycosylase AlkC